VTTVTTVTTHLELPGGDAGLVGEEGVERRDGGVRDPADLRREVWVRGAVDVVEQRRVQAELALAHQLVHHHRDKGLGYASLRAAKEGGSGVRR